MVRSTLAITAIFCLAKELITASDWYLVVVKAESRMGVWFCLFCVLELLHRQSFACVIRKLYRPLEQHTAVV